MRLAPRIIRPPAVVALGDERYSPILDAASDYAVDNARVAHLRHDNVAEADIARRDSTHDHPVAGSERRQHTTTRDDERNAPRVQPFGDELIHDVCNYKARLSL